MKTHFIELPAVTDEGTFLARYSEKGLTEIAWPKVGRASPRAAKQNGTPAKIKNWHRLTETALEKMLAGCDAKKLPPLDWHGKTEFQQSVWKQMLKIPAGKTKSYGEIAAALKNPKAVRAVGGACGANPIPVLVPCHRILAANKKLGGFSGGLDWKRSLLAREGILMRNKVEDKVVAAWRKAASDLKFKFTDPFIFTSKKGRRIECLGLVHRFGERKGTLISVGVGASSDMDYPLFKDGFSQSCLGTGHTLYQKKEWIEMLCDWGFWGNESEWPQWFSPGPVCHLQYIDGTISHSPA